MFFIMLFDRMLLNIEILTQQQNVYCFFNQAIYLKLAEILKYGKINYFNQWGTVFNCEKSYMQIVNFIKL